MKKKYVSLALIALLVSGIFGLHGADAAEKTMTIHKPWARATSPVAKAGGAFMILHNDGKEADRLVAVESAVATRAEVHQTKMENGVMLMQHINGIDIAPGKTVTLEPGSYHVMFMGLKQQLTEGTTISLTLVFEKAGRVVITVPVKNPGAGMNMGDHNHDHGHDTMKDMHKNH